jgi:hypothetical protein
MSALKIPIVFKKRSLQDHPAARGDSHEQTRVPKFHCVDCSAAETSRRLRGFDRSMFGKRSLISRKLKETSALKNLGTSPRPDLQTPEMVAESRLSYSQTSPE